MFDADKYSYVYVVKCRQFVKIGIAGDVASRLRELQTGNPFPLEILREYAAPRGVIVAVEMRAHDYLRKFAHTGEWFHCDQATACAAIERALKSITGRLQPIIMPKRKRAAQRRAQTKGIFSATLPNLSSNAL